MHEKEKGVTLVELMITIAILVILVSMVSGTMISGNTAKQKALVYQKMDNSISKTLDIIKRVGRSSVTSSGAELSGLYIDGVGFKSFYTAEDKATMISVTIDSANSASYLQLRTTNDTVKFKYSTSNRAIYVVANSSPDDPTNIIGENIQSVPFSYLPGTKISSPAAPGIGVLKISIVLKVKSSSEKSGWAVRTVTDTVMSRMAIKQN